MFIAFVTRTILRCLFFFSPCTELYCSTDAERERVSVSVTLQERRLSVWAASQHAAMPFHPLIIIIIMIIMMVVMMVVIFLVANFPFARQH